MVPSEVLGVMKIDTHTQILKMERKLFEEAEIAIKSNDYKTIFKLIQEGMNPNWRPDNHDFLLYTALACSSKRYNSAVDPSVRVLVQGGASAEMTNSYNQTILSCALAHSSNVRHRDVRSIPIGDLWLSDVEYITRPSRMSVESLNRVDDFGVSALMYAIEKNRWDIAKLLLQRGAESEDAKMFYHKHTAGRQETKEMAEVFALM